MRFTITAPDGTCEIEADDYEDAVRVANAGDFDPADHDTEWVPAPGTVSVVIEVAVVSDVVVSPSGWTFRSDQENGDEVACRGCGNPLNDDHPLRNDADGYAFHQNC